MTIRLLEHYVSIQGEGPRVGTPTQFVRFAGCNLKCPGWPCDTPFAIFPNQFTKEQRHVPLRLNEKDSGLIAQIVERRYEAANVCLTGGEPLLQNNNELIDLAESLHDNWQMSVEMFTNGTLPIPYRLLDLPVNIVMDWKLDGSGDFDISRYGKTRRQNLYDLASTTYGDHAIKFVCASGEDLRQAINIYEKLDLEDWPGDKYFGVVWGSDFDIPDLVEVMLAEDITEWKLNIQIHNYIWPAHERAR